MPSLTRPRGIPVLQLAFPLLMAALAASTAFGAPAPAAAPRKSLEYVDGVLDSGQFLPNSAILARVADRKITVLAFREYYFRSRPEIRPKGDSLGRAEFLTNMIRKEVLGLTALAANYPLNFEDRATLREFRATTLSNRLFERDVLSVPDLPEDSLRTIYELHKSELKLRVIHFTDRAEAEAVRRTLAGRRAAWKELSDRHNPPAFRANGGELNWARFENVPTDVALELWRLKKGDLSRVLPFPAGYQVFEVLDRRPRPFPDFSIIRPSIENLMRNHATSIRRQAMMAEAKRGLDFRYDSTNAVWASKQFSTAVTVGQEGGAQSINIDDYVPEFTIADTARTILTWKGGRISLGDLSRAYSELAAVMRPVINTPELLMDYADAIALAPRMVELAIERGLEKDPLFVANYERKVEEIVVTKMVEDSCFSRVMVTPKERRDFYQQNRTGFITFPAIRYAVVVRSTKEAADSVLARLRAGEKVADILLADSLAGNSASGIKSATTNDREPILRTLFEEMRPGQARVFGPDREKKWACMELLEFDPGRQLPYSEVEALVDESVRNLKSEAALNAFVARHMKRYPIEARYDQLMLVKLTTPGEDEHD